MGTRLKEHQGQCKRADKTNRVKKDTYNDTGLPLHHKNEHHEFQWEQASILEIERDTNRRRLLEAIHIYKNKDVAVNVYSGKSDIPKSWFPTLDKLNLAPYKDWRSYVTCSCNIALTNERKCMCCCVIISNFLTIYLVNRYWRRVERLDTYTLTS